MIQTKRTCRPGALLCLVHAAFYKHAAPLGLRRRCLSRPMVWVPHPLRIQFRFPSFPSSASFALLRLCVVFLTYYASRLSFLPFPFSRFLTPSPPRLLVFSFARFGYFFVSFFYIPTFCWLRLILFSVARAKTQIQRYEFIGFLSARTEPPNQVSHHFASFLACRLKRDIDRTYANLVHGGRFLIFNPLNPPTPLTRGEDKRGSSPLVFPLLSEGFRGTLETQGDL